MKKYAAILIYIICSQLVNAQTFQWQGSIGGNDYEFPNSIWVGSDGYTYITGNYSSPDLKFGTQVLATNVGGGIMNFFLGKFDNLGNPVFVRDAQYTSDAIGLDVRTDSNQNIYNLIINNSPFWLTIDNDTFWTWPTDAGAILLKYNSNGNFLWGKPFSNGDSFGIKAGLDIIDDNNIITCSSNISDVKDSLGNVTSTTNNLKICDFESSGNIKWTRTIKNIPDLCKIQTDRHGNINLLCNKTIDSVYVDSQFIATDSYKFFIIRFNKNGDFLEYIPFISNDDFEYVFFTIDNKDNIYFTGSFFSLTFSAFNLPAQHRLNQTTFSKDIFIVKTDYHGVGKWLNSAKSYSQKSVLRLTTDSIGDFYCFGNQYSDTGIYYNNVYYPANPGNHNFLLKLDTLGNLLDYIPSTSFSSIYYNFRVTAPNEIYITSQIGGNGVPLFGTTTVNSYGGYNDIWFGKFTYSTSVNQKFNPDWNISIYPNPADDFININIQGNIKFQEIWITDLYGKIVKPLNIIDITSNRINISELAKGVYFINVSTDKGNKTFKFIKI
ncbi:MAG: T9SS type A sorting domain-containing protein [Saprospiraceae bacterium]|nr:T9SS type A sorting domain-containing protein [Saprospiraceae bacterium]